MALSLQKWQTTQEGQEMIRSQEPFCIEHKLYQGYEGAVYGASEDVLSDDELKAVHDVDNTLSTVWRERAERLELIGVHKRKEYEEIKAQLRARRTGIITSMKETREMNLPDSPDDIAEIEAINKRMARLVDLANDKSLELAQQDGEIAEEIPAADQAMMDENPDHPAPVTCSICDKRSPINHKNPANWLKGHEMGAHKSDPSNLKQNQPKDAVNV